jgi:branched-subunit amino acid ABC-type transport system permease component
MTSLVAEQLLNGVQLGVMLFLLAAGLTLVFGIMGVINLAHGSLYMIGAYAAALTAGATGSWALAALAGLGAAAVVGMAMELLVLRRLYARDHLDQVLATLRADPVLQPGHHHAGRPPAALRGGAGLGLGRGRDHPRRALSGLSAADHRGRAAGGARPLPADPAQPHRHAGARPARRIARWCGPSAWTSACSTRSSSGWARCWRGWPG